MANNSAVRQLSDSLSIVVPANAGTTMLGCVETRLRDLAAQSTRVLLSNIPPSDQRAQGMPGARCARSRACGVENTRVGHHGHTGITRHSPRNGFNGFLRALPGDRACLPRSE